MARKICTLVICLLLCWQTGTTTAVAQEQRSPSILEFFGIKPKPVIRKPEVRKAAPKASKPASAKVRKTKRPASGPVSRSPVEASNQAEAVVSAPTIPEKSPDAKTILVLGDFMADGVSEGIEKAFELEAGVKIVSRANGSSGFVRDDYYNWPVETGPILAEVKPHVIVFMIGTNDRQQMRINGEREPVLSANWTTEYDKRVAAQAQALKASGIPVVWIGMPPFKQNQMNADMLALNDVYRRKAEAISGRYVDIWEGFLDAEGAFSINGFDHIGQPARLRASDGINLTFAGKRKIAFFAEKPLREALGALGFERGIATISGFDPFQLPGPKKPSPTEFAAIVRTTPISLFDPAFDGSSELLGAKLPEPQTPTGLPVQKLYLEGVPPSPVAGRVDAINAKPMQGG